LLALNNLILRKKQLDADMEAEMDVIAKKYGVLTNPIVSKSMDVITGKHIPSDDQIEKIKAHLTGEELAKAKESLKAEHIPDYWLTVIKNC